VVDVAEFDEGQGDLDVVDDVKAAGGDGAIVGAVGLVEAVFSADSVPESYGQAAAEAIACLVVEEDVDILGFTAGVDMNDEAALVGAAGGFGGEAIDGVDALLQSLELVGGYSGAREAEFVLVGFQVAVVADAVVWVIDDEMDLGAMFQQASAQAEHDVVGVFVLAEQVTVGLAHASRIRPAVTAYQVDHGVLELMVEDFHAFAAFAEEGLDQGWGGGRQQIGAAFDEEVSWGERLGVQPQEFLEVRIRIEAMAAQEAIDAIAFEGGCTGGRLVGGEGGLVEVEEGQRHQAAPAEERSQPVCPRHGEMLTLGGGRGKG